MRLLGAYGLVNPTRDHCSMVRYNHHYVWPLYALPSCQWLREAELMAVWIGEVEVTFAPLSVARGRVRDQAIGQGTFVKGVDVGNVEDDTSPPRPLPILRLADEVQVRGADGKASESRILPSVPERETEAAVKSDRASHIVSC